MRWTPRGRSSNIEDRRGARRIGGGLKLGLGGTLLLLVLSLVFKQDFFALLGGGGSAPAGNTSEQVPPASTTPEEDELVQVVSFVLDDTQAMWARVLPATFGVPYQDATLVLFRDATRSACGLAQTATGPFYCPGDGKVYIDLGFYSELKERFGAPGDFAQAYVIAHEIGHHVQDLLGTSDQVQQAQQSRPGAANPLSVQLELQADCYAGVWGYAASREGHIEPGDFEEGLNAAAAIGDDRLQRQAGGTVSPESFTHGSSAQRVEWLRRGLASGDPRDCDTGV